MELARITSSSSIKLARRGGGDHRLEERGSYLREREPRRAREKRRQRRVSRAYQSDVKSVSIKLVCKVRARLSKRRLGSRVDDILSRYMYTCIYTPNLAAAVRNESRLFCVLRARMLHARNRGDISPYLPEKLERAPKSLKKWNFNSKKQQHEREH